MDMAAILVDGPWPFVKIFNPLWQKAQGSPYVTLLPSYIKNLIDWLIDRRLHMKFEEN